MLWRAEGPLTPAEVRAELDRDLAYTTVMTVLGRLHDKGMLSRTPRGRAFAYATTMTEWEFTAQRMGQLLANTHDRARALTGFVGNLSRSDAEVLRKLMRARSKR